MVNAAAAEPKTRKGPAPRVNARRVRPSYPGCPQSLARLRAEQGLLVILDTSGAPQGASEWCKDRRGGESTPVFPRLVPVARNPLVRPSLVL